MSDPVALLAYLAPLGLAAVAGLARHEPGRRPQRVLAAGRIATAGSLALAGLLAARVAIGGALESPVVGSGAFGLAVRLDALSAVMFGLVAFVGVVVVRYSHAHLDGDPRQGAFVGNLCGALAGVVALVLSGHLTQLVLAWIATSVALHRLLLFYPERPRAVLAAHKKFVVARLGDACLVAAVLLLATTFGSWRIGDVLAAAQQAQASGDSLLAAQVAAVLLAVAAMLKSAQFPTHGWLLEVVETPTPVSALLHAGIINAGGFLLLRLADVLVLGGPALPLLAFVGAGTALVGSLAMLTQTSVKLGLAYSTVAQMGFMVFECGLGAFRFAALHLVAHSLYKAHAFLSAGSALEAIRQRSAAPTEAIVSGWPLRLGALAVAIAIFGGVGAAFGVTPWHEPVPSIFGAVLVLGLAHLLVVAAPSESDGRAVARAIGTATAIAIAYFALERGVARGLVGVLPDPPALDAPRIAIVVATLATFAAAALVQSMGTRRPTGPRWDAAYVHVRNGFYANVLFDRLVRALERRWVELGRDRRRAAPRAMPGGTR